MIYTSAIELPLKEENVQSIFLAGSIDLHLPGNWREKVIEKIGGGVHFFDPTISGHNELSNLQMEVHINWELDALSMADKILLNFLPEAESPISLVELGLYVSTNRLVVVCPKEFYKSRYVQVLCKKYNTPLFLELEQAIDALL
jgi:hypothetical protein